MRFREYELKEDETSLRPRNRTFNVLMNPQYALIDAEARKGKMAIK